MKLHLVASAPTDQPEGEYRLVAGGYRNQDEAFKAMLDVFRPLLAERLGSTDRFGLLVRPITDPVKGGRRTSGWGVWIHDRRHQNALQRARKPVPGRTGVA